MYIYFNHTSNIKAEYIKDFIIYSYRYMHKNTERVGTYQLEYFDAERKNGEWDAIGFENYIIILILSKAKCYHLLNLDSERVSVMFVSALSFKPKIFQNFSKWDIEMKNATSMHICNILFFCFAKCINYIE